MLAIYMSMLETEDDKSEFEKLYNKYKNKVYTIFFDILKNEQLAEDEASETFLSLTKCYPKIKGLECHKLDYCIVITSRNTSKNILKRKGISAGSFLL